MIVFESFRSQLTNEYHLRLRQLRHVLKFAASQKLRMLPRSVLVARGRASFLAHVSEVVGVSANEEMERRNARAHIAPMAHKQTILDRAVMQQVAESVRKYFLTGVRELAVAVSPNDSLPQPALIHPAFYDMRPEAGDVGWRWIDLRLWSRDVVARFKHTFSVFEFRARQPYPPAIALDLFTRSYGLHQRPFSS